MPVRVKVRAAIWIDGLLVVHRSSRQGSEHLTLPGGRIKDRESVLEGLAREVREEIGLEIEVGPLLLVAEIFAGASRQDVELIFEGHPRGAARPDDLALVDPGAPEAELVMPPVVGDLVRLAGPGVDARTAAWLGNLHIPGR